MNRGLESRISRLEQYRKPQRSYVVHCSDPPTADELSEISRARAEGRRFAILPRVCQKSPASSMRKRYCVCSDRRAGDH